ILQAESTACRQLPSFEVFVDVSAAGELNWIDQNIESSYVSKAAFASGSLTRIVYTITEQDQRFAAGHMIHSLLERKFNRVVEPRGSAQAHVTNRLSQRLTIAGGLSEHSDLIVKGNDECAIAR